MKIKQVEELVGITRKNIRFYEEQGLLSVERAENGYREYSLKDMREVFEGKKSLTSCLEYQVEKMEREKKNLTQVQEFCETLLQEKLTLEELDAEACLERMEQLEKEGTNFMNIQKTDVHKKKIRGAFLGAGIMLVLMAGTVGMILWGNSVDPLPIGWLLFLIAIPVAFVIAILVALRARLNEIKGGEEDEASKY